MTKKKKPPEMADARKAARLLQEDLLPLVALLQNKHPQVVCVLYELELVGEANDLRKAAVSLLDDLERGIERLKDLFHD